MSQSTEGVEESPREEGEVGDSPFGHDQGEPDVPEATTPCIGSGAVAGEDIGGAQGSQESQGSIDYTNFPTLSLSGLRDIELHQGDFDVNSVDRPLYPKSKLSGPIYSDASYIQDVVDQQLRTGGNEDVTSPDWQDRPGADTQLVQSGKSFYCLYSPFPSCLIPITDVFSISGEGGGDAGADILRDQTALAGNEVIIEITA